MQNSTWPRGQTLDLGIPGRWLLTEPQAAAKEATANTVSMRDFILRLVLCICVKDSEWT